MTYVPEYWKDNKKRIVKAKKHTTEMKEKCILYKNELAESNQNST